MTKKIINHALNQIFGSGVNMASNIPTPEQPIREDDGLDVGEAVRRYHEGNENKDNEEEEPEPVDENANKEEYNDEILEEVEEVEEDENEYVSPC